MPIFKKASGFKINTTNITKASFIIQSLTHQTRLQILHYIHEHPMTAVTPIYKALILQQPDCSHQLGILRKAGIVTTLKKGKQVYYSINYDRIDNLNRIALKITRSLAG